MYIPRSKVEKEINILLQTYGAKKKIKEKIIAKFQEHGFLYGEALSIITGNNPLMQLQDEILWLLIIALSEVLDGEPDSIDAEKVLTDIEITKAKNLVMDRKEDSEYPIVIENVNKDGEDDYSTVFTAEQIAKYYDNRVFKYNYETQRPRISRFYGGKEVKEIHVNEKAKKAIEANILSGTQIPDEITLNILLNGEESLHYDPSKKTLIIESGDISMIDGWHRSLSTRNAFKKNPNIDFYLKVRIVHWEVDKAKAFIHQKSLGTQLDPLAKKSYDVFNPANQIVKRVNDNHRSPIRNKITTERSEIQNGNALIEFNTLFDSIKILFKIDSNKEVHEISNYIIAGLDVIADQDMSILENIKDDRLWVAYMAILQKFYKQDEWQSKVSFAASQMNEEELKEIPFKVVNKPFVDKIREYVDGKLVTANV